MNLKRITFATRRSLHIPINRYIFRTELPSYLRAVSFTEPFTVQFLSFEKSTVYSSCSLPLIWIYKNNNILICLVLSSSDMLINTIFVSILAVITQFFAEKQQPASLIIQSLLLLSSFSEESFLSCSVLLLAAEVSASCKEPFSSVLSELSCKSLLCSVWSLLLFFCSWTEYHP